MTENANVAVVQRWFEAAAAGDLQTALTALSPALRYCGYRHLGGSSRVPRSRRLLREVLCQRCLVQLIADPFDGSSGSTR